MSAPPVNVRHQLPPGHAMFVRYAYPPNELGYCGPTGAAALQPGAGAGEVAAYARQFDGSWPYLRALAGAAGGVDPLAADVVRAYWVGGTLLGRPAPAALLAGLREAFAGQSTGLLGALDATTGVIAHHSFHVLVVYPWLRYLDRAPDTALPVLQSCRIRWGTVESVDEEHAVLRSRPLTFDGGALGLGAPVAERVRWRRNGVSLIAAPRPGDTVAAHWDWVCDTLSGTDVAALTTATHHTVEVVNTHRHRLRNEHPRGESR
ncbi:DUF6390 family protein [Mycolicibacterium thermoresistibile]